MPSGRSLRMRAMASRTSETARSTGVPISKFTNVLLLPSRMLELISVTPLIPRTAASTRRVIWISSSGGAAPGWLIETVAAGDVKSGWRFASIRLNAMSPMASRKVNNTSGMTGLRIAQAEMLRISPDPVLSLSAGGLSAPLGTDGPAGVEEGAGRFHDLLAAGEPLGDGDAAVGHGADPDAAALHRIVRAHDHHIGAG